MAPLVACTHPDLQPGITYYYKVADTTGEGASKLKGAGSSGQTFNFQASPHLSQRNLVYRHGARCTVHSIFVVVL